MHYSIKDVENLTGIKAHTLRIWEQRYNFLVPHRTHTNIRFYDAKQVKKLLNIALLLQNGFQVSIFTKLTDEQIAEYLLNIVDEKTNINFIYQARINCLLEATLEFSELKLESELNECIREFGFEQAVINIVAPFMEKIGFLWATGDVNVAQEHFVSNLIRRKIITAIDSLPPVNSSDALLLILFLPEGELHELGLLFTKYLIKKRGTRVLYLGQNLPYEDLTL